MSKGIKGFVKGHKHSEATKKKIGDIHRRPIYFDCTYCSKHSITKLSHYKLKKNHFCSTKCYANYRLEKMKPYEQNSWKGGITKETQRGRGGKLYKMWQVMVYERDGYSCVNCCSKEQIEAHHIKSWSKYPKLRYNVDNGKTLCIVCHNKTRGYENKELL